MRLDGQQSANGVDCLWDDRDGDVHVWEEGGADGAAGGRGGVDDCAVFYFEFDRAGDRGVWVDGSAVGRSRVRGTSQVKSRKSKVKS
jgi:hypothetical protein